VAQILKAIAVQRQSEQWQRDRGQYIPHPATWLHQRRWEDEAPEVLPAKDPYVNFPRVAAPADDGAMTGREYVERFGRPVLPGLPGPIRQKPQ